MCVYVCVCTCVCVMCGEYVCDCDNSGNDCPGRDKSFSFPLLYGSLPIFYSIVSPRCANNVIRLKPSLPSKPLTPPLPVLPPPFDRGGVAGEGEVLLLWKYQKYILEMFNFNIQRILAKAEFSGYTLNFTSNSSSPWPRLIPKKLI